MNRVAVLRRKKRWNQAQLAEMIGRRQSWVSLLEMERLREEDIKPFIRERLETIFGEPISELLRPAC